VQQLCITNDLLLQATYSNFNSDTNTEGTDKETMKNNSLASQEMKGNSEKETVNISSYKLHLCCKTSMKKRKMKWRGKTDSNFLVYAYFICKYASMIAGMLRDMTKNTPCIFHNCISSQRLPYLI
jgi:hypothetical protein